MTLATRPGAPRCTSLFTLCLLPNCKRPGNMGCINQRPSSNRTQTLRTIPAPSTVHKKTTATQSPLRPQRQERGTKQGDPKPSPRHNLYTLNEQPESSISPTNTASQITHNAFPPHHHHDHTTSGRITLDPQTSLEHPSDYTTTHFVPITPGGYGIDDNKEPRKGCAGVCFLDRLWRRWMRVQGTHRRM